MNNKNYLDVLTEDKSNLVEDSEARRQRMKKMRAKIEKELASDQKFYDQYCRNTDRGSIQAYQCKRTKERIKRHRSDLRAVKVVQGTIGGVDKVIDKIRGKKVQESVDKNPPK